MLFDYSSLPDDIFTLRMPIIMKMIIKFLSIEGAAYRFWFLLSEEGKTSASDFSLLKWLIYSLFVYLELFQD